MVVFRFGSQRLGNFLVAQKHDDLVVLKDLIEAGKIAPFIGRTFPLSEVSQALGQVGEGHVRGKVVISVSSPSLSNETREATSSEREATPVEALA
jgi:NADPH:quinone reductase-like Zn-dependent oxidoreductase